MAMATRRSRSAGRLRRFLAFRSSRLEGTSTWPLRMGPGNSEPRPGLPPAAGRTSAADRWSLPEERPVGRGPAGIGGFRGWHGGWVSEHEIEGAI